MTLSLGFTSAPFSWTVTIADACKTYWTFSARSAEDTDSLVTITPDVLDVVGNLKPTMQIDFSLSDGGDASKARSKVLNFGIQLVHTDGVTWEQLRKLTYSNPCDTPTFFATLNNPLIDITHVLSLTTQVQSDLASLTPDTASNSQGSSDHYSFCKDVRQYTITAASPPVQWTKYEFDSENKGQLQTALAAAQLTEVESFATLKVNAVIGCATVSTATSSVRFIVSCQSSAAYRWHLGSVTPLTTTLNSGSLIFNWELRKLKACESLISLTPNISDDPDSLVTVALDPSADIGNEVQQIVNFNIQTDGVAARVRTRTFDIIVDVNHSTAGLLAQRKRQITFTNKCQRSDFFSETAPALVLSYSHVLGVSSLVQNNIGSLLTDQVSALEGDADGYTYCNDARVYTLDLPPASVKFDVFQMSSSQKEILNTRLAAAHSQEFSITFNIKVDLVIEADSEIYDSVTRQVEIKSDSCKSTSSSNSYAADYKFNLRQKSVEFIKPLWTWSTLCSGTFEEKIEFVEPVSNTPINLPLAGVTVEADFKVKLAATKEMVTLPNYHPKFTVKYSISNKNAATPTLIATETSLMLIDYLNECGDPLESQLQPFAVQPMQTSVMRIASEYPSTNASKPDTEQTIADPDAKAMFLAADISRWHRGICGDIQVEVIHDGRTSEFVTVGYTFDASASDRYIKVLPNQNEQVGSYGLTLRLKFSDMDYSLVFADVPVAIEVLPCEIKFTMATGELEDPFVFAIIRQTAALQLIRTKKFIFVPDCDYPDHFEWTASPSPTDSQDEIYSFSSASDVLGIQTLNQANAGLYEFAQTVAKTDYASAFGISEFKQTIRVQLLDPCSSSTLQASFQQTSLYALVGHGLRLFEFDDYKDEVSLELDADDDPARGRNLRKSRSYSLQKVSSNARSSSETRADAGKNTLNDFILLDKSNNSDKVQITYGSSKAEEAGSHSIEVHAKLSEYPTVQHTTSTIAVTLYLQEADLSIADHTYTLTEEAVLVAIPQPRMTAKLHASSNEQSGASGDEILIEMAQVENGLPQAISSELAQFDASAKSLKIESTNPFYVGSTTFRVIYKFKDYLDGYSLNSEFTLTVKPQPVEEIPITVEPKLFFDLSGLEVSQTINVGEAWTFGVPSALYPDQTEVAQRTGSVKLGAASSFLTFDKDSLQLSVDAGVTTEEQSGSFPLKMQVAGSNGIKTDYLTVTLEILSLQSDDSSATNSTAEDSADKANSTTESNSTDAVVETATQEINESIGLLFAEKLHQRREKQARQAGQQTVVRKIEHPKATLASIDALGTVRVAFSKPMLVSRQYQTMAKGSTLEFGRRLQLTVPIGDIVEIQVLAGEDSEPENLKFSWAVQDFFKRRMAVKLQFEKPLFVSSQGQRDALKVTLKSKGYLVDEDFLTFEEDQMMNKLIPKQFGDPSTKQALEQTKQLLDSGTQLTMVVNIGVNFLQASSLQYLWDMINAQQIVILTPLFEINIPQNAMIFFGWLMQIASMEALPTDWMYSFFSDVKGRLVSPIFAEIGLEHHLILNNYGTLGFVFACLPFLYLLHKIGEYCRACRCCRRCTKALGKKLYWGILLRSLIEGYVIGLFSCLINLRDIDFSQQDKWTFLNAIITVYSLVVLALFPAISVSFLLRNLENLSQLVMQEQFGEMTEGYKLSERKAILYWVLDYVRKALLVVVVVYTNTHFWLQLITLIMTSIMMIIASGYIDARTSSFDSFMDIFNEAKLIFIMYHMMLFTDFVPEPETQSQIGYSCGAALVLGTAANMLMLFIAPIKRLKNTCKLRHAKQKAEKARKLKRHLRAVKTFDARRQKRYNLQKKSIQSLLSQLDEREAAKRHIQHEQFHQEQQIRFAELHNNHVQRKQWRRERMLQHMAESILEREAAELGIDLQSDTQNNAAPVFAKARDRQRRKIEKEQLTPRTQHTQALIHERRVAKLKSSSLLPSFSMVEDDLSRQFHDYLFGSQEESVDNQAKELATLDMREEAQGERLDMSQLQNGPIKLTWQDLDILWNEHGIGISQIQTIAGYEDFEVVSDSEAASDHEDLQHFEKKVSEQERAGPSIRSKNRSVIDTSAQKEALKITKKLRK